MTEVDSALVPLPEPPAGLLLYPGASGGADSRTLVSLERGLAPLPVRRSEFANRAAGGRGPERPELAVAHVIAQTRALAHELGVPTARIAVGGRSFGGRMASMAVAGAFGNPPLDVAALVLLSYPLHPPGRPDAWRTEHLARITAPTLVVSGSRDPFGTPEELRTQLAAISGSVTFAFVTGTHAPTDGPVVAAVRAWLGLPEPE